MSEDVPPHHLYSPSGAVGGQRSVTLDGKVTTVLSTAPPMNQDHVAAFYLNPRCPSPGAGTQQGSSYIWAVDISCLSTFLKLSRIFMKLTNKRTLLQ